MPLMIGGGGEKRTLLIAAKYANEWNVWGTPEVLIHKQSVLDAHCSDVHRDPAEIQRSACMLLMMTDNEDILGPARASGRPVLGGSNDEIQTNRAGLHRCRRRRTDHPRFHAGLKRIPTDRADGPLHHRDRAGVPLGIL